MLNIFSIIYVAVASVMIGNDAESIKQYAAERSQVEVMVTQIDEDYSDLWMN